MDLKIFEKCPKRDGSTTPKTGYMTLFYDLWLIITPKPFPSQKEFKIFRRLKFVEHDLRTLFWAVFGAKVTPPGYPVGVGVPEKGHLGSGEMGHPSLDEKNGCQKILPASGLV